MASLELVQLLVAFFTGISTHDLYFRRGEHQPLCYPLHPSLPCFVARRIGSLSLFPSPLGPFWTILVASKYRENKYSPFYLSRWSIHQSFYLPSVFQPSKSAPRPVLREDVNSVPIMAGP